MKFRISYALFLILFLVQPCYSQTISLEEFLELVKESYPFFAKEKLSVDIERKQNEHFLGSQDWALISEQRRNRVLINRIFTSKPEKQE